MKDIIKVKYIGKDEAFWGDLQGKFVAMYPKMEFAFDRKYGAGKEIYGDIFLEILETKPDLIYVDFSLDPVDCLYLAKLIIRENSLKHIPIVGLVDLLAGEEQIFKGIFTGIPFLHIKGGDFFTKVYDSLYLARPKDTRPPNFATGKVDEPFIMNEILRVGYLTEKSLHVEGDVNLDIDELISLKQSIFNENQVPSSYFTVTKKGIENLYYDYSYSYDLDFQFKEEPGFIPPDQLGEREPSKLEAEKNDTSSEGEEAETGVIDDNPVVSDEDLEKHQELLDTIKNRVKKFVNDNFTADANSKSTKVLVIDNKLEIYNQSEKRLEMLPYSFRTQTHLKNFGAELPRFQPNIIVYKMDDLQEIKEKLKAEQESEEAKFADKEAEEKRQKELLSNLNDQFNFQRMVGEIKNIEDYEPFIIVFGDKKRNSATWQKNLSYQKIIALSNDLDLNLILNIADKFQTTSSNQEAELLTRKVEALKQKNPKKFGKLKPIDLKEKRVFFKKSDKRSWAFFQHKVIIKEINEAEVYFESLTNFKPLSTFFFEKPVKFFITTVEIEQANKWSKEKNMYRGLIHVISESELANLRKFINSYFFKDKMAKEQKEREEFLRKNKEALDKKSQPPEEDNGEDKAEAGE